MGRPNNAAAIGAHVEGLREAKAAFQALPEIVRDAMLAATEVTVREIARGAKARLQASPSIQTRNLYNAVAWSINKKNGRGRVGIGMGTTTITTQASFARGVIAGRKIRVKGIITAGAGGGAAGGRIDKPSKRAHYVEFGTKHMPAEPFMIPAADAEKDHFLARCRAAGRTIETETARIGGGSRHL